METTKSDNGQDQNACKRWLQARTVGLPTAWARLMNFNFVRSTKSVVWIPSNFVQDPGYASQRTLEHLAKNPVYPDPVYYLPFLGKYPAVVVSWVMCGRMRGRWPRPISTTTNSAPD